LTQTPWYALKVKPRFERSVATHLRSRGYDPFLPVYSAKRQWSDRVKSIELALFPGYLFCQFDLSNRLPILTSPGVNFIVGVGKAPQAIADHEIDAIRSVIGSGLYYEPYPYLNVGELVRIEQGALTGLVGRVTEVKNSARLVISVNLLMRSVSAEIDRKWITPVEKFSHKQYLCSQPA
jgi:transcription antitermination factor NusG